ncbi:uncharacterized protein F4812DRAFT_425198 [Daldinia caldariorum]|uniref:uncharacterized protein n=1 Tax=Daldinia caldariorum TaxID=326644 RepID=UPI002007EF97|nr:uncharacterized protein F4812DRAFT_425198 [Daldinia caldariorum]KAI1468921.1 hypothetical protein F4812DRAFT_425198 [Daldinia caldariorum]
MKTNEWRQIWGPSDPSCIQLIPNPTSCRSWSNVYFLKPNMKCLGTWYVNATSLDDDGFVFITVVYAVIPS